MPAGTAEKPLISDSRGAFSVDPINLFFLIFMLLIMIAVPSFESNHKLEIQSHFGTVINELEPLSELGWFSIFFYASIVAVWDGISVLPARYIELFVAISFTSV